MSWLSFKPGTPSQSQLDFQGFDVDPCDTTRNTISPVCREDKFVWTPKFFSIPTHPKKHSAMFVDYLYPTFSGLFCTNVKKFFVLCSWNLYAAWNNLKEDVHPQWYSNPRARRQSTTTVAMSFWVPTPLVTGHGSQKDVGSAIGEATWERTKSLW